MSALVVLIRPEGLGAIGNVPASDGRAESQARRASLCAVINAKLLLLAVKRAQSRLVVAFSSGVGGPAAGAVPTPRRARDAAAQSAGQVHDEFLRAQVPALYNDLWDLTLDTGKLGQLDSVVATVSAGALLSSGAGAGLATVWTAGEQLDPGSAGLAGAVSLATELHEEVHGAPFALYDNVKEALPRLGCVAVGGTFDHMHNGHKKLLSVCLAVLRADGELVVGVTHQSMLGDKKGGSLIEDVARRKQRVIDFLDIVAPPTLRRTVVTIEDVWGPTAVRADIEGIVVSTEVIKGARLINEQRASRGFAPLQVVAVARSNVFTLSSTFVRTHSAKV